MSLDAILSRLEKVRRTGNSYLARCPAHDDRTPSFAVTEASDGRILAKCFGGCSFDEIVGAVGLDVSEWFPPKEIEYTKPFRRSFPAGDVLAAVADEAFFVAYAAAFMSQGGCLSAEDKSRLMVAVERILEARRAALGE